MTEAVVFVRFDEDGNQTYHVFGQEKVRLFIVDERAPDDRVYEWTQREDGNDELIRSLLPEGAVIGSSQDERHEAIAHRILAYTRGRSHLAVVEPTND